MIILVRPYKDTVIELRPVENYNTHYQAFYKGACIGTVEYRKSWPVWKLGGWCGYTRTKQTAPTYLRAHDAATALYNGIHLPGLRAR